MTAEVIQFKSRADKKRKTKKQPASAYEKSDRDIFKEVMDDVLGEWQIAAGKDQLDEYIRSKIPAKCQAPSVVKYVNDLHVLSALEQKLKMKVAIFYPGCLSMSKIGWLATFHLGKEAYATPPDMASEGYARAMCIVLFLEFQKNMKSLGRKSEKV